jgi:hypothetical protein
MRGDLGHVREKGLVGLRAVIGEGADRGTKAFRKLKDCARGTNLQKKKKKKIAFHDKKIIQHRDIKGGDNYLEDVLRGDIAIELELDDVLQVHLDHVLERIGLGVNAELGVSSDEPEERKHDHFNDFCNLHKK